MKFASILFLLLLVPASFGQKGETPPYDPAPPSEGISAYTNQNLEITLYYPTEFISRTPEDLQTVMERGHRLAYGTNPESDPEHLEALRCMHTLMYATADAAQQAQAPTSEDNSPDTILVEDVDRTCIPKKLKGDKALTALAGTVLHLPGSTQLVQQMWFVAGGNRHIHSGMSGTIFTPPHCSGNDNNTAADCAGVPSFLVAAAVEQEKHYILIVYLSGTPGGKHQLVRHMSIAFKNERPVLLFPFLMGKVNLIK